jgi:ElaB/YqjD/DUF883 family membrane-anchored ribosome-binding protein
MLKQTIRSSIMTTAQTKVKRAINSTIDDADLESRFEQAKSEFYKIAANLSEMGSAKAREYTDMASNVAANLKDDVNSVSGDALDNFMEQVSTLERDVTNRIRQKPLQALAIAGGIGFLFALLSRR